MSKALEYTKDIVIAKLQSPNTPSSQLNGNDIAIFFEIVYKKISALEKAETEADS